MIASRKLPVVEPKESSKLQLAIADYVNKINECAEATAAAKASGARPPALNGAVFFAVCRGKVSEGLDFADRNGRAVVIVGLPFPSSVDPKVKLKKEYMDRVSANYARDNRQLAFSNDKPITGNQWYNQSCWRAVNQAIGRVIRHRNDFGTRDL